jgi:hypothetical protein
MSTIFSIVGILFVLSLIPLILLAVRTIIRYRGPRVVTCPEKSDSATVKLDIGHAVCSTATGDTELRVRACSHWPERRECGQGCMEQLAASPSA